jgi:hypothetical protein
MAYENVLQNPNQFNFQIQQIGEGQYINPSRNEIFVDETERIAFSSQVKNLEINSRYARSCQPSKRPGHAKKSFTIHHQQQPQLSPVAAFAQDSTM